MPVSVGHQLFGPPGDGPVAAAPAPAAVGVMPLVQGAKAQGRGLAGLRVRPQLGQHELVEGHLPRHRGRQRTSKDACWPWSRVWGSGLRVMMMACQPPGLAGSMNWGKVTCPGTGVSRCTSKDACW